MIFQEYDFQYCRTFIHFILTKLSPKKPTTQEEILGSHLYYSWVSEYRINPHMFQITSLLHTDDRLDYDTPHISVKLCRDNFTTNLHFNFKIESGRILINNITMKSFGKIIKVVQF